MTKQIYNNVYEAEMWTERNKWLAELNQTSEVSEPVENYGSHLNLSEEEISLYKQGVAEFDVF